MRPWRSSRNCCPGCSRSTAAPPATSAGKTPPHPFAFHANLAPHIPARFGCTVCHGGQGLASDKQSAHGKVAFWQEPLLPKEYIRASCGRCHKEGEVPGVPELTDGRRLFETQGCRGCHKLNGVGGTVGPDLTEE